jgi:hypothetical protein
MGNTTFSASATTVSGILTPGFYPLLLNQPVRLLADASRSKNVDGLLEIKIDIDINIPTGATFFHESWDARVKVPFWCDTDGHIHQPSQTPITLDRPKNSSLEIEVYNWNDNLLGWPLGTVDTPPNIRVLHVLMMSTLRVRIGSGQRDRFGRPHREGWISIIPVDGKPFSSAPRRTDPNLAVIGPMLIEVVQPCSKLDGIVRPVYFGIDHSDIASDEGSKFDHFVRSDDSYEVRVALQSGMVMLRGECRASATFKGNDAERVRYNQQLSEQRKATLVKRVADLGIPQVNTNKVEAIGDRKAKSHEEDEIERRCDFVIDGDELLWAVQELWKANRFLGR